MGLYKSIVAYDGTDFHGFQRQRPGERTVQSVLEEALRALAWTGDSILAAGRTDTGVHAVGQVIAFHLEWRHSPKQLGAALNAHLPADVAIRCTELAESGFNPRFSALRRRYRYQLLLDQTRDPLRERYAWRIWPEPEVGAMQEAAAGLLGRRNFGVFGRAPIDGGHTVRSLFRAEWERVGRQLSLVLEADAFLRHMARRMVSALLDIGWVRLTHDDFETLMEKPAQVWAGGLAPPQGLCLERVLYEDDDEWSDRGAQDILPEAGRSEA